MTAFGWAQIVFCLAGLMALVKPLGGLMARVSHGERTSLDPVRRPIERLIYRMAGIHPEHEIVGNRLIDLFLVGLGLT
jgi:K+-transporting ATPase ATPase A chain